MRIGKKYVTGKYHANMWLVWAEHDIEKRVTKSASNMEYHWFVTEQEADEKIKELNDRQRIQG